jgi:diguanylate cyclase (GGDEF)-like protein/PAS domain S-box-containing protein
VLAAFPWNATTKMQDVIARGKFFEALFQNTPIAIATLDKDHLIVATNPSFQKLFGYTQDEIIGKSLDSLIVQPEATKQASGFTQRALSGESLHETVQRKTKDGRIVDVELIAVPVQAEGRFVGALGLYQDVTARKQAEAALRESERRYREIFENASEFLYSHDMEGRLTDVNPILITKSGYSRKELLRMSIRELMPVEHRRFFKSYLSKLENHGSSSGLLQVESKEGDQLVIQYNNVVFERPDGAKGVRGTASDVTELKNLELRLKTALAEQDKLARSDVLTNLYNRRGIMENLEAEAQRAQRENKPLSVALLDLDNLKDINDTHGHQQGDIALQKVAEAVLSCRRNYDRAGRYGGDEFLVVFPGATSQQAEKICTRILKKIGELESPIMGLVYSASCGVASFHEGEAGWPAIDDVLGAADDALYKAKSQGGNAVRVANGEGV